MENGCENSPAMHPGIKVSPSIDDEIPDEACGKVVRRTSRGSMSRFCRKAQSLVALQTKRSKQSEEVKQFYFHSYALGCRGWPSLPSDPDSSARRLGRCGTCSSVDLFARVSSSGTVTFSAFFRDGCTFSSSFSSVSATEVHSIELFLS